MGDEVLFHIPQVHTKYLSPTYTPWKGIYKVVQKTSNLTYTIKKKGGEIINAPADRLKFYDKKNSHKDPTVEISMKDDVTNEQLKIDPNQRLTRSKTRTIAAHQNILQ